MQINIILETEDNELFFAGFEAEAAWLEDGFVWKGGRKWEGSEVTVGLVDLISYDESLYTKDQIEVINDYLKNNYTELEDMFCIKYKKASE